MRFLLACDGPSDAGLVSHIERLIADAGETEVDGESWFRRPRAKRQLPRSSGGPLADKIRKGLEVAEGMADLLFVHRDAESQGAQARFDEIAKAMDVIADAPRWVGVVPVRMTEAWLILDEGAIRSAVGRPNGQNPLDLPTPREAERRADPKDILANALLAASEATGRRRQNIQRDLGRLRQRLLTNLPIHGRLAQLESWARFRDDTLRALSDLRNMRHV